MFSDKIISQTPTSTISQYQNSSILKTVYIKDPSTAKLFLEDLKQWKSFDHPNIVKVEDFKLISQDDSNSLIQYVTEKIPKNLLDLINERATTNNYFSKEEFIIYCLQLLSAFLYLEKRNTAHKNLKLSNILVLDSGELKITDLGNPKIFEEISSSSLNISPELRKTTDYINILNYLNMDTWRLGTLFLELGKLCKLEDPEFQKDNIDEMSERYGKKTVKLLQQITERDPARRSSLRKAFDDLKKEAKKLGIE